MKKYIDLINKSGYDIYFLVVDKNLDINLPELKYFYKIYLPKNEIKNSAHLLSLPETKNFIETNSTRNNHLPAILPFKPSAKIDKICEKNAWLCLSNTAKLNRFLEDKIKFYKFCTAENLPVIPSNIDTFTQENFIKYSKNKPIVIQSHFGWAGNSTFQSDNFNDLKDKIAPNILVKFSPLIDGKTYINNCCFTRFGLIQSPVALQVNDGFHTVGRSWPSGLNPEIQKKIIDISNQFGKSIAKFHYRGYFGLDFMVQNNDIYILECNPRLTASFAFYHHLETINNLHSLIYFHLLELLDVDYQMDFEIEKSRLNTPINGKELTPRDKNNQIIEKIHEI